MKNKKLRILESDRALLEQGVSLREQQILGLQQDKVEYKKEADQYRALYVKADEQRVKAISEQPSRFVWFGVGASTVLVLILTAFIISQ